MQAAAAQRAKDGQNGFSGEDRLTAEAVADEVNGLVEKVQAVKRETTALRGDVSALKRSLDQLHADLALVPEVARGRAAKRVCGAKPRSRSA